MSPIKAEIFEAVVAEGFRTMQTSHVGHRYKGDVVDSSALACLQKLETFEVAPPRLADRREFILRGGDCICLDWWDIHSDMGSDTKPSQGFERRLKTNAELCGTSVRWSWCKLDGEYYLVRSP